MGEMTAVADLDVRWRNGRGLRNFPGNCVVVYSEEIGFQFSGKWQQIGKRARRLEREVLVDPGRR
jgi:hypothetical protein